MNKYLDFMLASAVLAASVFLLAIKPALAGVGLKVDQAWSPKSPSAMHAAYMVIENSSSETLRIVGFSSPFYRSVSLHDVKHEQGLVKMFELDSVSLAPGEKLTLQPGGKHLMLMGAEEKRQMGQAIPVSIKLENGERFTFQMVVTAWQ